MVINSQYYGYYYNWYAAVAGTVSGNVAQEAPGSICPKGWGLPVNSTSVGSRSYGNLMFQSGVIGNIGDYSGYTNDGFKILTSYPMYFLRAGDHYATGTGVRYRGSYGNYWTRSSYSTTNAYYLYFSSSYVSPRYNSHLSKPYGFTVRCVAL